MQLVKTDVLNFDYSCHNSGQQEQTLQLWFKIILDLQPIPGDPKDNGVAAMLDDRTFCFVIQHGRHAIVFLDLQGLVANQE